MRAARTPARVDFAPLWRTARAYACALQLRLDEATLKTVATQTQAEYFYAGNAETLKKVYEKLSSRLTSVKKETEISVLLALVAAVLAISSAALSLLWFNRIL